MPSAQQEKIDEVPARTDSEDLHSLLRENHVSQLRNLNTLHNRGEVLFAEGEVARGVYILRTGKASVSISSREGRIVILRMAHAGEVLGLNSVLRNSTYATTVKTLEPCRTEFISQVRLIEIMQRSHRATDALLKMLSNELDQLTDRMSSLLLPQTALGRLARLLLEWGEESLRIDRAFTHEEIAQMICSSRETVTRLLATLSRRGILRITPTSLLICDREALERMT